MTFLTEIRSCLNCNSNTFLFTLLGKLNSLLNIGGNMTTKSIMKIPNKVIPILLIKRHKSTTHNNKLNFINIMSNFFKLLNPIPSLNIWIIPSSNSSHTSRLITSITLCTILKIRIRSTRTINTNISSCSNMWTSMWFTHYSYYRYTTCCTYRFCF